MRAALTVLAMLFPITSWPQGDTWSLELLERYASWVRDGGFVCPLATRVAEVGPNDSGRSSRSPVVRPHFPLPGRRWPSA